GLYSPDKTRPDSYREFSYPNYVDIRDRNQVFGQTAAFTLAMVGVGEGELTRRVFAFIVSANFFSTFGVQPVTGRGFLPEEERPGAARMVAIVSHEYWNKTGADPGLVGRTIRINARAFTVIGIAPRGFAGPTTLIAPAVWLPMGVYEIVVNDLFRPGAHTQLADRANHTLMIVGRLKPGLSLASAGPPIKALGGQMEQAFPGENKNQGLEVRRLSRVGISTDPQDDSQFVATFLLLQAMAAIVLLIACMNLANMLLARASARQREIAVRLAIGANRARVVRQLLTEGLVLSIVGGAGGLLLTFWALRFLGVSIDPLVPLIVIVDARPDIRVLAAAFGFAMLSTLVFGLGPAWKLARTNVVTELKDGDRSGSQGQARRFGFRQVLVVGQIALSLALLTAAGLFARGAFKASRAEPGFSLDRSVLVSLDPSLAGFDETRGRELYRRLLERARALPGVQTASVASVVPFGDFTEGRRVRRVGDVPAGGPNPDDAGGASVSYGSGRPDGSGDDRNGVNASFYVIGRDYFETLGIPIMLGRGFSEAEELSGSGARVAVIDEPLAKRLFPKGEPLGQSLYFPGRDEADTRPLEIVGVVRGTRHSLFDRDPVPHVFVPFGQRYRANMSLHVRTARAGAEAEAAALQGVRREIRALDDQVPIITMATMREFRDRSMSSWIVRASASLFAIFGGLALFLSVVGVYGVRAFLVSRRTREIGIRMALGATARDVLWLVFREGLVLVAVGLGVGFILAWLTGLLVASRVYEVGAFDPLVFALAPVLLALSALLACYVPARRATKVAPVIALHAE
ncbi:MAG: ABC transporter permease, partial [Acidobacteria bacterium]|nr:ABC transporter permease [Acidobacteriota bacterium]